MPRRRPSALRGDRPARRARRRRYPNIDHLSGSCTADLRRLERSRFWPEATEEAFWHWRTLAHGPLGQLGQLVDQLAGPGCGILECGCYGVDFRGHLETVLHALPKKSARELRVLVRALDGRILSRARVVAAHSPDVSWWRDRL
ncbi:hypothetical protein GCM10010503_00130 [Streptomyces lucensis JCM 4490]|uniref:Uncharacterized protein n=1 Tax=Streptomyces lucensis JCM 4490 TaxID=1306176 RepID=A0A918ISF8_9ACTN|nr:hypothetical protein [Streptomyces lucensis]GGW28685.1 hypothetical protein GCM10010503_00130 [Streptomyces lucensis JCM 4490]